METTNINTDVRGAVVRGAVEAVDPEVRATVRKWYERLGFSKLYDEEFYRALDEIPISDRITLEDYPKDCTDGLRNLLSYLWLCERTAKKCAELGIPESIVVDTLSDIVIWTADPMTAVGAESYTTLVDGKIVYQAE